MAQPGHVPTDDLERQVTRLALHATTRIRDARRSQPRRSPAHRWCRSCCSLRTASQFARRLEGGRVHPVAPLMMSPEKAGSAHALPGGLTASVSVVRAAVLGTRCRRKWGTDATARR